MYLRKRSSRRPAFRPRSLNLLCEALEPRIALSTFNVGTESELRSAILTAEGNSSSANTINLTASITLSDTSAGALEIPNSAGIAKNLVIQGASRFTTISASSSSWNTRIFEIAGTATASVTVVFKNLTIKGGRAHDGGSLGGNVALGGGILIDGGQVTLSHVAVTDNDASGAAGANGAAGAVGKAAGNGGNGGAARAAGFIWHPEN